MNYKPWTQIYSNISSINWFVSAISPNKINHRFEKNHSKYSRYSTQRTRSIRSSSVNNISRIKISLLNSCKQNRKFYALEGRRSVRLFDKRRHESSRILTGNPSPVIESSWRGWKTGVGKCREKSGRNISLFVRLSRHTILPSFLKLWGFETKG